MRDKRVALFVDREEPIPRRNQMGKTGEVWIRKAKTAFGVGDPRQRERQFATIPVEFARGGYCDFINDSDSSR